MYVHGLIRLCKVSQGPGEVTLAPIESISTTVMNPFYTKYLDVNQYPLSLVPSAIIEKHMGTVTTVNADGVCLKMRLSTGPYLTTCTTRPNHQAS